MMSRTVFVCENVTAMKTVIAFFIEKFGLLFLLFLKMILPYISLLYLCRCNYACIKSVLLINKSSAQNAFMKLVLKYIYLPGFFSW